MTDREAEIRGAVQSSLADRTATIEGRVAAASSENGADEVIQDDALDYLSALEGTPLGKIWLTDQLDALPDLEKGGIVAPLPRRKLLEFEVSGTGVPPMTRHVQFRASTFRALVRLMIWAYGLARFFIGNIFDHLLRRASVERSADRLRRTFERLGPTFVKLGQQLSMRADILPYEYTEALSKLIDSVRPMAPETALAVIERVHGRPVTETFAIFDPDPIGSASLACVYQAILPDGEKVAVKVRRPGIGPRLAADLKVLGWFMSLLEGLTILRPGMTRGLRTELRSMLMEELNFRKEARYTHLFRKRARRKGQTYVTAPRVYFDLSDEEVLVTEFVSGVFLWELISALDRQDNEALALLRESEIDPKQVALNMNEAFHFWTMECPLFHADPHPGNVVVEPGNRVVFLDFGSCGRFSSKTRICWKQLHGSLNEEDVNGMVQAAIAILEPLPHVDIETFTREIEGLFWGWLYALEDENSEWWEKATGTIWIQFLGIVRRHEIPMNLEILRLFRATFLYDTTIYRLHRQLDIDMEYQRYIRHAGARARKRVRKQYRQRMKRGLKRTDYVLIEDLQRVSRRLLYRIEHELDKPDHVFQRVLGKVGYIGSFLLQIVSLGLLLHIGAVLFYYVSERALGQPVLLWTAFSNIVDTEGYQILAAFVGLILVRRLLKRMRDVDVREV